MAWDEPLVLGGRSFGSRLIVGTGKYPSFEVMKRCHQVSGTEMVTVAVRRVDLSGSGESLLDFIDLDRITLLPNTAGCYTAEDAVTAQLHGHGGIRGRPHPGVHDDRDGHLLQDDPDVVGVANAQA